MTAINLTFAKRITETITKQVHIAPLVVFRILFGLMMLAGIIRFAANGWIEHFYIKPVFHFTYYGFEWVKPFGANGMYLTFILMGVAALFISLGFLYRISSFVFFVLFTYVELIDKSTYLNHYYFISIVSFLMIFVPASGYFSLDSLLNPKRSITHLPRYFIIIIQLQLGLVYFFAGVAKINSDWLFEAMPLRIWLQAHTHLPLIGYFMDKAWIAYFFSWFGMIYDICIPFFLINKKTRGVAYFFVIVFHVMTRILFQIGMFPYIMIVSTLIFFSENFHLKIIHTLKTIFGRMENKVYTNQKTYFIKPVYTKILLGFMVLHFTIQILMPFRYVLYPGNLFWTEQGYRFSWRVMLMEKAGKVFFHVKDKDSGKSGEIMNDEYLNVFQEKMMSTQADMILQYAHFLKEKQIEKGIKNPEITAECYVTLNGSGSRMFIDKNTDLTKEHDGLKNKTWILPFEKIK